MANTITGMIKVFKQNELLVSSNTITVSSGADGDNIKDFDRDTRWTSVGSTNATTETVTNTFDEAVTISRLLLIGINLFSLDIQYWDGADWADFSNVYMEGVVGGGQAGEYGTAEYGTATYGSDGSVFDSIDIDSNTDTSLYFEFDAVSTTIVRIRSKKTFVVDDQKYITELYIGSEIGTFVDDLTSRPNSYVPIASNTNSSYIQKSNGGTVKLERSSKYSVAVEVSELFETGDQDIIYTMYDDGQFAIYPCGGIPYTKRGWREGDFYHVIIKGDLEGEFSVGRVEDMGLNHDFELLEQ